MATPARTAAERAAAKLARQRRLDRIQPGWWVYLADPGNPRSWGSWAKVTTTYQFIDATARPTVRLTALDPATGRGVRIELEAGYPASSLTPAEARRAGLT